MNRGLLFRQVGWVSAYHMLLLLCLIAGSVGAAPPVVSNVEAHQRTDGSKIVDIFYDLADPDSSSLTVTVRISDDDGATFTLTPRTISGDIGGGVRPGARKHIVWEAGVDLPGVYGTLFRAAVTADDGEGPGPLETITVPLTLPAGAKPLEMVLIPAGGSMMGSPDDEQGRWSGEGPQHEVTITKPFYIGKYEVTQAQWQAVMGANPSYFKGENRPVEGVSWDDCQEFIKKLNQMGLGSFRLPTEAEWEYACRAGTETRFYWGDDPNETEIKDYAWYSGNSGSQTHEVGLKKPNAWGLFDMSGNVWEWCEDDWHDSYSGAPRDGSAWVGSSRGSYRVLRGGSWDGGTAWCRSAVRSYGYPGGRGNNVGFRLARTP